MVEPAIWGPPFWATIHFAALGCPAAPSPDDRVAYADFYALLGRVIPCGKCRRSYLEHLQEAPVDVSSGPALFAWTVDLHNRVNAETGKPPWSAERCREFYLREYGRARSPPAAPAPAAPGPAAPGPAAPAEAAHDPRVLALTFLAALAVAALAGFLAYRRFRPATPPPGP